MSKAVYWQNGDTLDYKNETTSKIEANTIIAYGARLGVAGCDIEVGELGSIYVKGVFTMPKSSANEIAAGSEIYWDGNGITDTSGSDTVKAGYAAYTAAADASVILVHLNA